MNNKVKKRTILSLNETRKFIVVWKRNLISLRSKRNSHVFRKITQELADYGITLSVEEARTRVNNLTKRFRKEKLNISQSAGSPSTWQLFDEINEVLGGEQQNDQISESIAVDIDPRLLAPADEHYSIVPTPSPSIRRSPSSSICCSPTSESSSVTQSPPKSSKDSTNEQLLEIAKEETKILKDFVEHCKKSDEERINLLKEHIRVQKALLEYIKSQNK